MKKINPANKGYMQLIVVVSIAIPLIVAFLLFAPFNLAFEDKGWIRTLPAFNAVINTTTSLLLLAAFVSIKAKMIRLHRNFMTSALVLGAIFLLSYVLYHASTESTVFGDLNHDGTLSAEEQAKVGSLRIIYLVVLLSHIGLSIVVVPFVLLAFYYALSDQIERHKKLVKFTFPIWLYVSITGVIVYLMISPYYL